jgi:tRNA U34 5-methylaminomethyl-2-thiouridine-forming methyltransferase MnmC
MKRELRITEDGSHTLFVHDIEEPYHSMHGAIQESRHIFIIQGLLTIKRSTVRILELGLGTGLNLILTLLEAIKLEKNIHYHAVEKYPLLSEEYRALNYEHIIPGLPSGVLERVHSAPWNKEFKLSETFSIIKEKSDFRSMAPPGKYDLVYFDAFAPDKQPHLWSAEIFKKISSLVCPDGVLVSYSVKGSVRRALESTGFSVNKVPGPPGKREMIRATRI